MIEPEVWVIVRDVNVVHGHGDSGSEPVLAYKGWDTSDLHPAFTSQKAAQSWIDGNQYFGFRAQKLALREE